MKNRCYFPVKQQGAFAFTLRMLQSLSRSFRSVQAECQYELSTHPAWATCSSHFQTVLLPVPLRANASVLLLPPPHLNKPHREAWQEMKQCHSLSVFPWTKIQSLVEGATHKMYLQIWFIWLAMPLSLFSIFRRRLLMSILCQCLCDSPQHTGRLYFFLHDHSKIYFGKCLG